MDIFIYSCPKGRTPQNVSRKKRFDGMRILSYLCETNPTSVAFEKTLVACGIFYLKFFNIKILITPAGTTSA